MLKNEANTICELFKKCFELLYIERTMSLLDMVIGDDTVSNFSTSVSCGKSNFRNFISQIEILEFKFNLK